MLKQVAVQARKVASLQRGGQSRHWSSLGRSTQANRYSSGQLLVTATGGVLLCAAVANQSRQVSKCHGGMTGSCSERRRQLKDFILSSQTTESDETKTVPEYTLEEVSKQNGSAGGRIWMSYGGFVYDVTDFIPVHPGGTERILRAAGAAIEPFWYLHQQHFGTEETMQILKGLVIGRLAESDQEKVDAKLERLEEEMDGFRLEVDLSGLGGGTTKFSLHDLKHLPKTDITSQVGCTNNQDRRPLSTSIFGGVRMEEILGENNLKSIGFVPQFTFHAMDGEKVTVDANQYQDIVVCYEMDGAPLDKNRGFPLRVIIPGKRVVKWVQRIDVRLSK